MWFESVLWIELVDSFDDRFRYDGSFDSAMSLSEGASHAPEQEEYWADDAFRKVLREQPPSAKLVAKVLQSESELTQDVIVEETLLPRRTVSYALNRLEDAGLTSSRRHISDPRKQIYTLAADFER